MNQFKKAKFNAHKYFIEKRQDDIYNSISRGFFNLTKEDLIKFLGIIAYAWQCDLISDKEYTDYRNWAYQTQDTLEIVKREGV